jgi:hypothetical protein
MAVRRRVAALAAYLDSAGSSRRLRCDLTPYKDCRSFHFRYGLCALILSCLPVLAAGPVVADADEHWRPVKLGEARNGKYLWGANFSRGTGRLGGREPCVGLGLRNLKPGIPPERYFESFELSCSRLAADYGPNLVFSSEGSGSAKFTVGVFAVSPEIEAVRMNLGPDLSRTVKTKLLNARQRQIAGVPAARYATVVIRGPYCLGEVVGFDRTGTAVFDSANESCDGQPMTFKAAAASAGGGAPRRTGRRGGGSPL